LASHTADLQCSVIAELSVLHVTTLKVVYFENIFVMHFNVRNYYFQTYRVVQKFVTPALLL